MSVDVWGSSWLTSWDASWTYDTSEIPDLFTATLVVAAPIVSTLVANTLLDTTLVKTKPLTATLQVGD